jgi:hypothetical protein
MIVVWRLNIREYIKSEIIHVAELHLASGESMSSSSDCHRHCGSTATAAAAAAAARAINHGEYRQVLGVERRLLGHSRRENRTDVLMNQRDNSTLPRARCRVGDRPLSEVPSQSVEPSPGTR